MLRSRTPPAAGRFDAAALFPPCSQKAARLAGATRLFDNREIPGEILEMLVMEPQDLRHLSAALAKLLRAWQAAHKLRQRLPDVAIPVMARRDHLSPQAFRDAAQGLVYQEPPQQRDMLAASGALARSPGAVQGVQIQMGLMEAGSPLPDINGTSRRQRCNEQPSGRIIDQQLC